MKVLRGSIEGSPSGVGSSLLGGKGGQEDLEESG